MKYNFEKAKICIIGAKPSSRTLLKKLFVDYGVKPHHIITFNLVEELLADKCEDDHSVIVVDDDVEDISLFGKFTDYIKRNVSDGGKSLNIILSREENVEIIHKYNNDSDMYIISKPYTLGSFKNEFKSILSEVNQKEQKERKLRQENDLFYEKVNTEYKDFKSYVLNKISEEDPFLCKCSDFLNSIKERDIDHKDLSRLLNEGLESKRYKDLELFVIGWIRSLPFKDEEITSLAKVLLYNGKLDEFQYLQSDDISAKNAIGIGMILSASYASNIQKEKIVEVIFRGVELASYKPVVVLRSFQILWNLGADEKVVELADKANLYKTPDNKDICQKSVANYLEEYFGA